MRADPDRDVSQAKAERAAWLLFVATFAFILGTAVGEIVDDQVRKAVVAVVAVTAAVVYFSLLRRASRP